MMVHVKFFRKVSNSRCGANFCQGKSPVQRLKMPFFALSFKSEYANIEKYQ